MRRASFVAAACYPSSLAHGRSAMNAPATLAAGAARRRAPSEDLVSLDLIRTLVGFDTTSRDSNLALIDWVRQYLAGYGIASTLTFDDDRRKANLFATLPARDGNVTHGGIVLSGHTDVVPVDGQPWTSDPFVVTRARRPAVRPRRHRHEKLFRGRSRARARVPAARTAQAAALRLVLRRGSRLHRRAPADRRYRRARRASCGVHRRRADRHGARGGAQGQASVAMPGTGSRGALVADAARRERRADRVRDRGLHRAARARLPRHGRARRRLRRSVYDRARRHHPRRHRAQYRSARLHVRLRAPPPAVRRPRSVHRGRARVRRAFRPRHACRRRRHRHRVRSPVDAARVRHRTTAARSRPSVTRATSTHS